MTSYSEQIQVFDRGDYFELDNGVRTIVLTKDRLREIKMLYCGDNPLTINEVCRRMVIPRKDFMMIKRAFGITHDDIPFIEEDVLATDVDELVDKSLELRKQQYFEKLTTRDVKLLKKEVAQYRKRDYLVDRITDALVELEQPRVFDKVPKKRGNDRVMLAVLADVHTGAKTDNAWNVYNIDIMKARFDEYIEEIIRRGEEFNITTVHLMSLGDLIHGIIHESNRVEAELDVVQQVLLISQQIERALLALSKHFHEVYFYSTEGNHGRVIPTKTGAIDKENFELFVWHHMNLAFRDCPNVHVMVNEIDNQFIYFKIFDHDIYGVHGDRDSINKVASNVSMMMPVKPQYIYMGHTHRMAMDEVNMIEVWVSRSFSGVDNYAKSIRKTSKAGQSLYIFNADGIDMIIPVVFKA